MKVVTVSREYGAGGREFARLLAETLGWELLDRELLHQAAELEHLPDAELEPLDEKAVGVAERFRLHPPHERYRRGLAVAARRAAEGDVPAGRHVLTLTGGPGAGDVRLAPTIAGRLGLGLYDRELLEQKAARLGVSLEEVERFDEQPAGVLLRALPGRPHQRYVDALGRLMGELADRGDVLLGGRGGWCFLRDHPRAFHVRLMASPGDRVRRVMEDRWLAEPPARTLIEQTDARRRRFSETFFGADWSSPLGYHVAVNTGRLGPLAVDLVAFAAARHWSGAT